MHIFICSFHYVNNQNAKVRIICVHKYMISQQAEEPSESDNKSQNWQTRIHIFIMTLFSINENVAFPFFFVRANVDCAPGASHINNENV